LAAGFEVSAYLWTPGISVALATFAKVSAQEEATNFSGTVGFHEQKIATLRIGRQFFLGETLRIRSINGNEEAAAIDLAGAAGPAGRAVECLKLQC
jgi:hypothetical protein